MRRGVSKLWLVAALVLVSFAAPPARASDHLMRINEVMLSTGGDSAAQFVELDDPSAEAFPFTPYRLEIFDADANFLGSVSLPGIFGGAPFLVSTAATDLALGTVGDVELTVALPANGQVCFVRSDGGVIHCLAWGCIDNLIVGASKGPSPADGESAQRQPIDPDYHLAAPTPGTVNSAGTVVAVCPLLFAGDFEDGSVCGWSSAEPIAACE